MLLYILSLKSDIDVTRFTGDIDASAHSVTVLTPFDNACNLFCGIIIASTLPSMGAIRSVRVIDCSKVCARISYRQVTTTLQYYEFYRSLIILQSSFLSMTTFTLIFIGISFNEL